LSFLDNCRRLIGLDSTPSHGNLAAAEFVGQLCRDAGLHVEFQRESLEGIDQCNVIARPEEGLPPQEILFQTHLDTVDAGHFSHWTKTQSNPFNASIYNDVMYGLGTADTKLDFICKIEAAKAMEGRKMKKPFVLVGTFGAESGMSGAIKLIRRKKLNATHAFVGEPTEMGLVIAGQGMAVFEISIPFSDEERAYRRDHDLQESASSQSKMFLGKAAHSSDPNGGENAIMKMLNYLSQLPDGIAIMDLDGGVNHNSVPASAVLEIDTVAGFKDPILPKISKLHASFLDLQGELKSFREEGFTPAHPTVNIGMIRTTDTFVSAIGSCRLPPSVTDAAFEGWMRKLGEAMQSVGATFRVKEYRKGFLTSPESNFVKETRELLSEMGLSGSLSKITVSTEASVFGRLGIECLVWGPGQSVGNSHAPNESVKIEELNRAIEFYKAAMERFCL
jgi:succinyl-diaminopimelate desuccinylase